uniref:Uncharacterized protein n=1 Tax=Anguilla anguilla TaxID=7936 RepID=A0A0E9P7B4_ANGAN
MKHGSSFTRSENYYRLLSVLIDGENRG